MRKRALRAAVGNLHAGQQPGLIRPRQRHVLLNEADIILAQNIVLHAFRTAPDDLSLAGRILNGQSVLLFVCRNRLGGSHAFREQLRHLTVHAVNRVSCLVQ